MTLACVFVANYCKTTRAGSRRYGLNGRCPFFRISLILTAISPSQMSRNRRIKPWSSDNEKNEERAHRPREFQTIPNFIVTKPRFQGLCGGVIQNGGQLHALSAILVASLQIKDPGNEEGPSILFTIGWFRCRTLPLMKLKSFRIPVQCKIESLPQQ